MYSIATCELKRWKSWGNVTSVYGLCSYAQTLTVQTCSDIAGIVFTATAIAVSHLHLYITNTTPKMQ
jgi:hypothetical protein